MTTQTLNALPSPLSGSEESLANDRRLRSQLDNQRV